jgi:hypothetical protein
MQKKPQAYLGAPDRPAPVRPFSYRADVRDHSLGRRGRGWFHGESFAEQSARAARQGVR